MANNRRTASSASTANSSGGNNSVTSKLPKFLQKQPKSSYSPENSTSTPPRLPRKNTKISLFGKDSGDQTSHAPPQRTSTENSVDDLPVIVEPVAIPRSRTRSERPISAGPDSHPPVSFHASASYSGGSKIGDLPNRLSGWFSHAFSSSATDLTLPSLLSQSHLAAATSPNRGKATNALLTAAKQGKGHLDKALRYLIDSDAMPDKSTAPIWLLGVQHPGYEPHAAAPSSISRRGSVDSRRAPSYRSSASSSSSHAELPPVNPANNWPPAFYADFVSRVWLTYRSQFMPIRDTTLSALEYGQEGASPQPHSATSLSSSSSVKRWPWTSGEKGWTSDAGWGCMLRTGQSLLANALIHLHLGRDWRRPPSPAYTPEYAMYAQILTWFFDTPAPAAPFSVHRMALAGKDLGTEVGQWFGPSVAAGALKTLVQSFPEAGLGVAVAYDGVVFQSDVYAASDASALSKRSQHQHGSSSSSSAGAPAASWGGRAVLVLIGIRLGLDGVNPVYYDSIKALYTFPQSVGIAGGRPSSSYYFVGAQGESLIYLDPHHPRSTVPLRPAPYAAVLVVGGRRREDGESASGEEREGEKKVGRRRQKQQQHVRAPTSPTGSIRTTTTSTTTATTSTVGGHAPMLPSPLQRQMSMGDVAGMTAEEGRQGEEGREEDDDEGEQDDEEDEQFRSAVSSGGESIKLPLPTPPPAPAPARPHPTPSSDPQPHPRPPDDDHALIAHYASAYATSELRTFHCDRVRKLPLSGLDPSMLIGFLCRDEADWRDFRRRVGEVSANHKTIFTVQDEPPTWPSGSDDDMGFESISEPDDVEFPDDDEVDDDEDGEGRAVLIREDERREDEEEDEREEDEEGEEEEEEFYETPSPDGASLKGPSRGTTGAHGAKSSVDDLETEEDSDPMRPLTPGGSSSRTSEDVDVRDTGVQIVEGVGRFDVRGKEEQRRLPRGEDGGEDDEWVDPSSPTPIRRSPLPPPPPSPPAAPLANAKPNGRKKSKSSKKTSSAVPVVRAPPLPPVQSFPFPRSRDDAPAQTQTQMETQAEMVQYEEMEALPPLPPSTTSVDVVSAARPSGDKPKRMHTARARDGGRTQSGGVRGVMD